MPGDLIPTTTVPDQRARADSRELVDEDRLGEWMDGIGLPGGQLEGLVELAGGTQNILLGFVRGGRRYVLRMPPAHSIKGDDMIRREALVLRALEGSRVPHPGLIADCVDREVLGSSFYLMEYINGVNPTRGLPIAYVTEQSWRRRLGLAMPDCLTAISDLDYMSSGLADLGQPTGFLERQVQRWRAQLVSYTGFAGYPGPELPHLEKVATWLECNRPGGGKPGLIHGDFHFSNVLCDVEHPQLAAVVDWELATIGDPLLDLGGLLSTWPADDVPVPELRLSPWSGFPDRSDILARYSERSDRDLSAIDWYEVLACFRMGVILEGTHARACAGIVPQNVGEKLHTTAMALFARAHRRIYSS
jgi:aminoglycoside phosphotransferase (APT) family kinase protein